MTYDWNRLAHRIRQRRAELGLTQAQLAQSAGVTPMTIRNLETGREFKRLPHSLGAIEFELLWKPGSALAVLQGGEPTAIEPAGTPTEELPLAVRIALEFGKLLDYDVYTTDVDGEPMQMIQLAVTNAQAIDALKKQLDRFGEIKGYARRREPDPNRTDGDSAGE